MTKPNTPAVKKEGTEVAVAPTSNFAISTDAPEHLKSYQNTGMEQLDSSDTSVPRVKLIAATSPELDTYDDLRPGEFWHTVAEKSLGKSVLIVPVYVAKRYMLWKPRDAGGGILARANDGVHWNPANVTFDVPVDKKGKIVKWSTKDTVDASGLAEWGTFDPDDKNSQPAATLMYDYVVMLPDYLDYGPAVISLQRGSASVAKQFNAKLKHGDKPMYSRVVKMSSYKETNAKGDDFHNFRFEPMGFVADPTITDTFKALHDQFREMGVNIKDEESLQDEVQGAAATKANDKDF